MKRRTKVLLADDHAIVAEGLATLLKDHFDLLDRRRSEAPARRDRHRYCHAGTERA